MSYFEICFIAFSCFFVGFLTGAMAFSKAYKYEFGKFEKKEKIFKAEHQKICSKYSSLNYDYMQVKEVIKKLNESMSKG